MIRISFCFVFDVTKFREETQNLETLLYLYFLIEMATPKLSEPEQVFLK